VAEYNDAISRSRCLQPGFQLQEVAFANVEMIIAKPLGWQFQAPCSEGVFHHKYYTRKPCALIDSKLCPRLRVLGPCWRLGWRCHIAHLDFLGSPEGPQNKVNNRFPRPEEMY
jgi:hypothetical protein